MIADPLVDLVRSWQLLPESCFDVCRLKKKQKQLRKSIQKSVKNQKIIENRPQIYQKIDQKSIKIRSGSIRDRFGTPVCCRSAKSRAPDTDFEAFLAPRGRSGAPFGVQVAPNGRPRGPTWAPKAVKIDTKIRCKNQCRKSDENDAKQLLK